MDYAESRQRYFPQTPPPEHRLPGIYLSQSGRWRYFVWLDGRQLNRTRRTYWEAADEKFMLQSRSAAGRAQASALLGGPLSPVVRLQLGEGVESPHARGLDTPPMPLGIELARNGSQIKIDARGRAMPSRRALPSAACTRSGDEGPSISEMLDQYDLKGPLSDSDRPMVRSLARVLKGDVHHLTQAWVLEWVRQMKAALNTPATIKKKVECMARAVEWYWHGFAARRTMALGGGPRAEAEAWRVVPRNPFRNLPAKYHQYGRGEVKKGEVVPKNLPRERRLVGDEYQRVRDLFQGTLLVTDNHKRPIPFVVRRNQDTPDLRWCMDVMFQVLVNTAMRLRECFTLQRHQILFKGKNSAIWLPRDKTKTSTPRTIPMTPLVQAVLREWLDRPGAPTGPLDPVFPQFYAGETKFYQLKSITDALSRIFARAFAAIGSPDLREHDLRHEGVCRWVLMKNPKTGVYLYSESLCRSFTGHKLDRMFHRYLSLRGSDEAAVMYPDDAHEREPALVTDSGEVGRGSPLLPHAPSPRALPHPTLAQ